MHHKVAWSTVQRILIDAPSVDYDEKGNKTEIKITNENAKEMLEKINRMKR